MGQPRSVTGLNLTESGLFSSIRFYSWGSWVLSILYLTPKKL